MREKLTNKQLVTLLQMACDKVGITDLSKVGLAIRWWQNFRPCISLDREYLTDEQIVVFADDVSMSTWEEDTPCGFYINKGVKLAEMVTNYPLSVDKVLVFLSHEEEEHPVKLLMAHDPINYEIEIDPFKTLISSNFLNECVLSLHVDYRDSGEWKPFKMLESRHIKTVGFKSSAENVGGQSELNTQSKESERCEMK